MATAVVTIICIAIVVMGGVILTQGILTTADATALSVEDITLREGELSRTSLQASGAAELSWPDRLRVTVRNSGQTKLADFEKWDFIVDYVDAHGARFSRRLPYTTGPLGVNQWQKARIGLDGPVEFFEPGILNPGEELVALAWLDPLPSSGNVTIAAVNGIDCSASFSDPGHLLLVPDAENTTIAATRYYQLDEDATAIGPGATRSANYTESGVGRQMLVNENDPARPARHIFPLVGIAHIPAAPWMFYYCGRTSGGGSFPAGDGDVGFDVDILIRQADGAIRQTIATDAAAAFLAPASQGSWTTVSGNFTFPGYDVVDENDYLEVVYYARVDGPGPDSGTGFVQLDIDNSGLPPAEQTRIES